jgi:hypothetical protein
MIFEILTAMNMKISRIYCHAVSYTETISKFLSPLSSMKIQAARKNRKKKDSLHLQGFR